MTRLGLLISYYFFFCAGPLTAAASTRILDGKIKIKVQKNGSLEIQESLHFDPRSTFPQGFYRDLPTTRLTPLGMRRRSSFTMQEAFINGASATVEIKTLPKGKRIQFISPAPSKEIHIRLQYTIEGHPSLLPGKETLRWTALANEWSIPVEHYSVLFITPPDMPLRHIHAMIKDSGEDMTIEMGLHGHTAKSPRPLSSKENIILTASFAPGTFTPPPQTPLHFLLDNLHIATGAAGMVLLWLYFLSIYIFNRKRPVQPTRPPPSDLSPAAARFILYGRIDGISLRATILSLIDKKYLALHKEAGNVYARAHPEANRNLLTPDQKAVADKLLKGNEALHRESLLQLLNTLSSFIYAYWRPRIAARDWTHISLGIIFTGGIVAAMTLTAQPETLTFGRILQTWLGAPITIAGAAGVLFLWTCTLTRLKRTAEPPAPGENRFVDVLFGIGLGFLSFGAVVAAADCFLRLIGDVSPILILIAAGLSLTNFLFFHILRHPTKEGLRAEASARALLQQLQNKTASKSIFTFAEPLECKIDTPPHLKKDLSLLDNTAA